MNEKVAETKMKVGAFEKMELIRALADFTLLRHNFDEKELYELEVTVKKLSRALKANPIPPDQDVVLYDPDKPSFSSLSIVNRIEAQKTVQVDTSASITDASSGDLVSSEQKSLTGLVSTDKKSASRPSLLERSLLKHQIMQSALPVQPQPLAKNNFPIYIEKQTALLEKGADSKKKKPQIAEEDPVPAQSQSPGNLSVWEKRLIKNKISFSSTSSSHSDDSDLFNDLSPDSDTSPRIQSKGRKNEKSSLEKYLTDQGSDYEKKGSSMKRNLSYSSSEEILSISKRNTKRLESDTNLEFGNHGNVSFSSVHKKVSSSSNSVNQKERPLKKTRYDNRNGMVGSHQDSKNSKPSKNSLLSKSDSPQIKQKIIDWSSSDYSSESSSSFLLESSSSFSLKSDDSIPMILRVIKKKETSVYYSSDSNAPIMKGKRSRQFIADFSSSDSDASSSTVDASSLSDSSKRERSMKFIADFSSSDSDASSSTVDVSSLSDSSL